MNKKILFIYGVVLLGLVYAGNYGYTHIDGSQIIFDSNGKISGIYDSQKEECRLPTIQEKLENDYISDLCTKEDKNKLNILGCAL